MYNTEDRVRIFNLPESDSLLGKLGTVLNNEENLIYSSDKIIVLLDEPINNDKAILISKYCLERI